MHVGMAVIFQGSGEGRTDRNVYRNELRFGDMAEPLGFESLWGVEHHFTDYTMCPDVLQLLTYFAGRTRTSARFDGGRPALAPSDSSRGTDYYARPHVRRPHDSGIGRGPGRVEFEGFGVSQEDAREIFIESAQTILEGLECGFCEFDGKFVHQTRRNLRPRPF